MHKLTLVLLAAAAAAPAPVSSQPVRPATPVQASFPARPGISIVTLNMAKETSADRILAEWRAIPELRHADVFLLQEVREEDGKQCIAAQLAAALRMHVAYSAEAAGVADRGLAILSRFPLRDVQMRALKPFDLRFHSRKRFALAATAETLSGPVRLFNVHLDTRLNAADRLAQLDPVMRECAGASGRLVVAGDFNSNPFYWIDHVVPLPGIGSQARTIDRFMRGRGFRAAIPASATTFDYLGMHLDWIWVTGLKPAASCITPLRFSDHHAVWARLEF